jgi:hypothetical protein
MLVYQRVPAICGIPFTMLGLWPWRETNCFHSVKPLVSPSALSAQKAWHGRDCGVAQSYKCIHTEYIYIYMYSILINEYVSAMAKSIIYPSIHLSIHEFIHPSIHPVWYIISCEIIWYWYDVKWNDMISNCMTWWHDIMLLYDTKY